MTDDHEMTTDNSSIKSNDTTNDMTSVTVTTTTATNKTKKRNRSGSVTPPPNQNATSNAISQTVTTLATTPQSKLSLPALQSVLNTYNSSSKSISINAQKNFIKNLSTAVTNATTKILNDDPTYVHLSTKDSAPQLSFNHDKLTVKGAVSGYRMVRGTHGVSNGNWYYEVMIVQPPKVSEVVKALPQNVRLSNALREGLRVGMMKEREQMRSEMLLQRQQQLRQYQLMQQKKKQEQQQQQQKNASSTSSTAAIEKNTEKAKHKPNSGEEGQKKKRKKGDLTHTTTNTNTSSATGTTTSTSNQSSLSSSQKTQHSVGGHLRIGWSMRTGELQAPVGYDQWSYAYRDISGSRIHNSQREDKWGGESFGPGDIIGFAISLVDESNNNDDGGGGGGADAANGNHGGGGGANASSSTTNTNTKSSKAMQPRPTNHIRFFKNGEAQGQIIISRGVRTGGAAFDNIEKGTYYPAISPYMGGVARMNFGPHFVYPPRGLPSGMKVKPLSEVCSSPPSAEEVLEMFKKEKIFGKKVDDTVVKALYDAVQVEARMRYDCFQTQFDTHVEEVRATRIEKGLSTSDLPQPHKVEESDDEMEVEDGDNDTASGGS